MFASMALNGRTNRAQSRPIGTILYGTLWYPEVLWSRNDAKRARGILLLVSGNAPFGRDYETVIKFTRGLTILQTGPSAYVRTRVIYLKNINWHLK